MSVRMNGKNQHETFRFRHCCSSVRGSKNETWLLKSDVYSNLWTIGQFGVHFENAATIWRHISLQLATKIRKLSVSGRKLWSNSFHWQRIGATYIAVITCACHSTAQHRMKNEPTPKILCFPIQLQLMMIVQMLRFRFYLSIVTRLLWLLYLIWLAQQLAIYLHLITPPNWNELCVSLDSYRRFLYRSILHIMQEQLPSK